MSRLPCLAVAVIASVGASVLWSFTTTRAEAQCVRQCIRVPGGYRCRICCPRPRSYDYGIAAPRGFDPGPRYYNPPAYDYAAERRRREQEHQERLARERAEAAERRAAEARRIAQYQAQQRILEAERQTERDAEWERFKAEMIEALGPVLSAAGAFVLWVVLPFTLLVLAMWWVSTMLHRYRLHLANRNIERTRANTRRFQDVTADLKRARDEADAFIEQEARVAYERGRGL